MTRDIVIKREGEKRSRKKEGTNTKDEERGNDIYLRIVMVKWLFLTVEMVSV